jgi:hypothetical protein
VEEGMGLWKGDGKLRLIPAEQGKAEYALEPIEPDRRYAVSMLEKEADPDQDENAPKKSSDQGQPQ